MSVIVSGSDSLIVNLYMTDTFPGDILMFLSWESLPAQARPTMHFKQLENINHHIKTNCF